MVTQGHDVYCTLAFGSDDKADRIAYAMWNRTLRARAFSVSDHGHFRGGSRKGAQVLPILLANTSGAETVRQAVNQSAAHCSDSRPIIPVASKSIRR
ncbi:hypothetical protein BaRGS_00018592, partial [Batillaria attramentaria]